MSWIVILGEDLTSPEQIQYIAGLDSPPVVTPCEALNEDDKDDGTCPGCCTVDDHTKTALVIWSKTEDKTIKNMFAFVQSKPADTTHALRTYPVPYFFYGRLCDPQLWTGQLNFDTAPKFVEAEVRGFTLKMWGHYKALIAADEPDEESNIVKGYLYMVESEEALDKIAAYETDNYGVRLCDIYYGDGQRLEGCTFGFWGDLSHLKTVEEYELEQRAYEELEADQ